MNQGITISGPVLAIILCAVGLSGAAVGPIVSSIIAKLFGKSPYVTKETFDLSMVFIEKTLARIEKTMEAMNGKIDRYVSSGKPLRELERGDES